MPFSELVLICICFIGHIPSQQVSCEMYKLLKQPLGFFFFFLVPIPHAPDADLNYTVSRGFNRASLGNSKVSGKKKHIPLATPSPPTGLQEYQQPSVPCI